MIKVSNILDSNDLCPVLNEIYDARSDFFHSAKYSSLNDIFETIRIDFLLIVIREIIVFSKLHN